MNTDSDQVVDEIVDLEEYARAGKRVPRAKGYRFRVNGGIPITVTEPSITGRRVLELAALSPAENYTLRLKIAGQAPRKVALEEIVDLTAPGVEKFKALPRDQTEGEGPRRQCGLSPEDQQFLTELGLPWESIADGSNWVLIHEFPAPAGYSTEKVTVAVRMEVGYPIAPLDMVYFRPFLSRVDGRSIGATDARQTIDGSEYQRWSRHRSAQNPWKAGEDSLETHILLVQDWLLREFEK